MNTVRRSLELSCVATCLFIGAVARAQSVVTLDRHSRLSKNAVSVRPTATPGEFEVLDASGGDAFRLDYSTAATPRFSLASAPRVLPTRGVIVDIARFDPFVYFACFRGGVEIYDMASQPPWSACGGDPMAQDCGSVAAPCWSPPVDHDVRCIAVAQVAGERFVVAGTENRRVAQLGEPTGGSLFVLRHDVSTNRLVPLIEVPIGRPVLAVAAFAALPSANDLAASDLTVLLGANAARLSGSRAALQRRDFALESTTAGWACTSVARQGWTTTGCDGAPKNMIVRDIVVDVAQRRAYVAAHFDGVYAFDIDPNSSCQQFAYPAQTLYGLCPLANTFEPTVGGSCEACPTADWPIRVNAGDGATSCPLSCSPLSQPETCGAVDVRTALAHASRLALNPVPGAQDEQLLSIAWGLDRLLEFNTAGLFTDITQERSYLDADGSDEPASVSCGAAFSGVAVHRLTGGAPRHDAALGGRVAPAAQLEFPTSPMGIDAAFDAVGEFVLFANEYLIATRAYRFTPIASSACGATHELVLDGAWGPGAPGRIPGFAVLGLEFGSVDDQGTMRDTLYVAGESNLSSFWLDPANPRPLSAPSTPSGPTYASNPLAPIQTNKAAIRLAGVFEQGAAGGGARLVAATDRGRVSTQSSGGVRVFDLSAPCDPTASPAPRTELAREGQGYSVAIALDIPGAGPAPPVALRRRYLYAPFRDGAPSKNTGVKVWNVGSADAPVDPLPAPSTPYGPNDNRVRLAAEYVPPNAALLTLDAVAVLEDAAPDRQFAYVLYGAGLGANGPVGLLALEVRADVRGALRMTPLGPGVALSGSTLLGQYDADAVCDRTQSGFTRDYYPSCVALDASRRRIFAAWAGVIAMYEYDAAGPAAFVPRLLDARDFSASSGAYGMTPWFTSVAVGPVHGGELHLYFSMASDGLGVLGVGPATAPDRFGVMHVTPLPWQSTWIEVDPRDPTRNTLFAGQGSAGVDWLRVCWPAGGG